MSRGQTHSMSSIPVNVINVVGSEHSVFWLDIFVEFVFYFGKVHSGIWNTLPLLYIY